MPLLRDIRLLFDVDEFAMAAGLEGRLDGWQRQVLEAEESKILMACSRQVGKSTTASLLACHTAIYRPGALVLLVSPSIRQSGEIYRKCGAALHNLGVELAAESALRCELANGSRIVSLPRSEKTTRGYSRAALVVLDEAARIEPGLISAIQPSLAATRGGRFVAVSSPAGRHPSNWFWQRWSSDDPGWLKIRITAEECPRISPEFLAEQRRELGPLLYDQEYNAIFTDAEQSAFPTALIEALFSDDVEPLFAAA